MKTGNLSKNTILLAIGTFLNKGLLFVMIPIFSSWLSTEDYGRFDVYSTYATLLIPMITLACSEAVFRYGIEKEDIKGKSYYITNGFAVVLLNTILMTVALLCVNSYIEWEYMVPFIFMVIGQILGNYLFGYMRCVRKLNIYSFCTAVSTVCIAVCVTLFVAVLDMALKGMIWGYAIGYITGDVFIIIFTKFHRYISIKDIKVKGIKELLTYSYALVPNNISWWVINVSDREIINIVLGPTANGIYAIACKIPNLCSALFSVFSVAWQEAAADMVTSEKRESYYNRIFNQMCLVLLSLCGGIVCCNFIFYKYIFEQRYYGGTAYVPILVTSALFGSLSQYFGGIQISLKQPKANGITTMLGAVVNLTVHLVFINNVGLYAAAISTLVSNILIVVLRAYLLRKEMQLTFEKKIFAFVGIYVYFVVVAYLEVHIIVRWINLLFSGIVFMYINRTMIQKMIRKIAKKNI